MSFTLMKMTDFNDNVVIGLDQNLHIPEIGEKMAADVINKDTSDDLVNELDDLINDPSRFLKNDIDVALDFADLQSDKDLDLMNYFIGNEIQGENDQGLHESQDVNSETDEITVDLKQIDATTALENAINRAKNEKFATPARQTKTKATNKQADMGSKFDLRPSDAWSQVEVVMQSSSEQEQKGDPDYKPSFPTMSLSKAAIQAKENRAKKKQYISSLEKSVNFLTDENKSLKKETLSMRKTINILQDEVEYLTSVLANQSTLSALLKNVCSTPGIRFSSGLSMTDHVEDNHDSKEIDKMGDESEVAEAGKRKRSLEIESDSEEDESKENCEDRPGKTKRISKVSKLDHDYASKVKSCQVVLSRKSVPTSALQKMRKPGIGKEPPKAGVCLHVSNNLVSLEFCAKCSNKAMGKER